VARKNNVQTVGGGRERGEGEGGGGASPARLAPLQKKREKARFASGPCRRRKGKGRKEGGGGADSCSSRALRGEREGEEGEVARVDADYFDFAAIFLGERRKKGKENSNILSGLRSTLKEGGRGEEDAGKVSTPIPSRRRGKNARRKKRNPSIIDDCRREGGWSSNLSYRIGE